MAKKKAKKSAPGKKAPAAKKARSKATPAKKAAAKPKPRPRSSGGGQLVTFICAECYEDFTLDAGRMGETLTCPECLHVGKRPQDNFLSQVSETKGREKKILLIAALIGIITALAGVGLAMALSPYNSFGENATMIFGGGFALAALIGIVLAVQYEKNRWEVYF